MTRFRLIWLTVLILLLALAGCDGGGGGDGQGEVVDVANVDTERLGEGTFFLDISGDDVEIEYVSEDFDYRAMGELYELALPVPDSGYSLSILHFGYPADGMYPLQSLSTRPDTANVFAIGLLSLTSPLPEQRFDSNVQGTITVQIVEGLMTGSFEFVATNSTGERSITARGGFKALPIEG